MTHPAAPSAMLVLLAGCLQAPPTGPAVPPEDAQPDTDATPCPPADACVVDPASGHTYAAYGEAVSWDQAVTRCDEAGWYLASDLGEVESAIIATLLPDPMWIGLSDRTAENQWQWLTGEPFEYEHWRTGEPNGDEVENCVVANWAQEGWNDLDCADTWAYACETGSPLPN